MKRVLQPLFWLLWGVGFCIAVYAALWEPSVCTNADLADIAGVLLYGLFGLMATWLRSDINGIKSDINDLRKSVIEMNNDIRRELGQLGERVARLEGRG